MLSNSTQPAVPSLRSDLARRRAVCQAPTHTDPVGLEATVASPSKRRLPKVATHVEKAVCVYESFKARGPYRAVELGTSDGRYEAFFKFRETGGIDLFALDRDAEKNAEGPCLEHLYWPKEEEFRAGLHYAVRNDRTCPSSMAETDPSTEALIGCLHDSRTLASALVPWLRHLKPIQVPVDLCPGEDTTSSLSEEQAALAMHSFRTQLEGQAPAWELQSRRPRCEGWIRICDNHVVLMCLNNSPARTAAEPRIEVRIWPEGELRDKLHTYLYEQLKLTPNCPPAVNGVLPDIRSLLKCLSQDGPELEYFIALARSHVKPIWHAGQAAEPVPQETPVQQSCALHDASAQFKGGMLISGELRDALWGPGQTPYWAHARLVFDEVRLVDRLDAPIENVIDPDALLRLIELRDEGGDEWLALGTLGARAQLDPTQMCIRVDTCSAANALTIYLSLDGTRVVDMTGAPELEELREFAEIGLLCPEFVNSTNLLNEPKLERLSQAWGSPMRTVDKDDVELLGKSLAANAGRSTFVSWNASETMGKLPRSLDGSGD